MDGAMTAAALTPEELKAAKRYMAESGDDPEIDANVTVCVLAARSELEDAGVSLPEIGTLRRAKYDVICHSIALGKYDKRDPTITGTIVTENPEFRRTLNQLKFTEPRE